MMEPGLRSCHRGAQPFYRGHPMHNHALHEAKEIAQYAVLVFVLSILCAGCGAGLAYLMR